MTSDDIASYDPAWPLEFDVLGQRLRHALDHLALRIDHIGSTAVPGLASKPILDVQISVADLNAIRDYGPEIESCGFRWRRDNPDLTKRYFRELPDAARTHIHVRRIGSFDEQASLLFRDYLREQADEAERYAETKPAPAEGYVRGAARWAFVVYGAPREVGRCSKRHGLGNEILPARLTDSRAGFGLSARLDIELGAAADDVGQRLRRSQPIPTPSTTRKDACY